MKFLYHLLAFSLLLSTAQSSQLLHQYEVKHLEKGTKLYIDLVNLQSVKRETDAKNRLKIETFPNGKSIQYFYMNGNLSAIKIANFGEVRYEYIDNQLVKIHRVNIDGNILYTHEYKKNREFHSHEILIGNLGPVSKSYQPKKGILTVNSPLGTEEYNLNDFGQLTALCNTKLLDTHCHFNELGLLTSKKSGKNSIYFKYDSQNRLIQADTKDCRVLFTYDYFGRKLSKTVERNAKQETEFYLYFGINEIAICDEFGNLKAMRIPGGSFNPYVFKAIAYESPQAIFAPLHDSELNLKALINIKTNERIDYSIESFGGNLQKQNQRFPWLFSGKHYDKDLDLVCIGHRYYDPSRRKWITPDPIGTAQSQDLYQYCFDNPKKFIDPDGKFVFAFPIFYIGSLTLADILLNSTLTAGTTWIGYKVVKSVNTILKKNSKDKKYKKPKPRISDKEGAKGVPSWVKGNKPYVGESGKDFAKRLLDEIFGPGKYLKGPRSDYNQIKKWGDRAFE
ncbi:RHS repeat-associated core domain-containing protein [Patescibacteria group bacterium]|nr:RHS repeat-associated core domain-containing protein [Patescibacteria group bacterium]